MATAKTWVWIILGFVGVCVVILAVLAGVGVYFVASHVNASHTTTLDAQKSFDAVLASFKDPHPLFEVDSVDHARAVRALTDLPTSDTKPGEMWILAFDPDHERIVKVSVPFWLLRLGRRKIDIMQSGGRGFDLDRLHLDVPELERVGPAVVLDYSARAGERVLIWTR